MKEIKNNKTDLKIYINGIPSIKLMPNNILEILLLEIERLFNEKK